MYSEPIAYFITFTTRGTRLHGCEKGSVNRHGQFIPTNRNWERFDLEELKQPPIVLSETQREIVKTAIQYHSTTHGWFLHSLEVLINHVHVVVTAKNVKPEEVSANFKATATRMLRKRGEFSPEVKIWTRNSSERYVFNEKELEAAIHYVENQ